MWVCLYVFFVNQFGENIRVRAIIICFYVHDIFQTHLHTD